MAACTVDEAVVDREEKEVEAAAVCSVSTFSSACGHSHHPSSLSKLVSS